MVLLTTSLIEKKCSHSQSQKSLTKTIEKNYLLKMTHLYMNDLFIDAIGNISMCKNLRVIYLHNNNISRLENFNFATNLTHLYLQHNNISKLENLNTLKNLTHLFVGYNCINVVEGLENLKSLWQLHIEQQRLPTGESLTFDPRTIYALSSHLTILNIVGNNIISLEPLRCLENLERLDARNNKIDDILRLSETVKSMKSLQELSLQENPVTNQYRYWENIVSNSNNSLAILDGKKINNVTRCFLNRFKDVKQSRLERQNNHLNLSKNITASLNLPPAFERSVSRAIIQQYPGPKLSISDVGLSATGETQSQIFPPWKTLPSIASNKDLHITPRPFWRRATKKNLSLQRNPNIIEAGIITHLKARIEKCSVVKS